MKKIYTIILISAFAFTLSGYSQIYINGKQWKPKSKEEKEAEKKKKEEQNAKSNSDAKPNDVPVVKTEEKENKQEIKQEEKKEYTEEEIMKIMDKNSYPDYKKHMNVLSFIDSIYNFKSNSHGHHDEEDESEIKEPTLVDKVNWLKWSFSSLDTIKKIYSEYWKVYMEQTKATEPMRKKYDELAMDKYDENGKYNYGFVGYGAVTGFLQSVKSESDYKNKGNPIFTIPIELDKIVESTNARFEELNSSYFTGASYDEQKNFFKNPNSQRQWTLDQIDYKIAVYIYTKGENDVGTGKLLAKRNEVQEELNKADKKLNEEIITKATAIANANLEKLFPPNELYNGSDKEILRKQILAEWSNSDCKQKKIVKVIFTEPKWQSRSGRDYDKNAHGNWTGSDYNYSKMYFTIICKDPSDKPEHLRIIDGSVYKDNIAKSKDISFSCNGNLILSKNVK